MGNLYVKDGTPVGNKHLCKGCSNGQYVTGYRETDVLVVCTLSTPSFRLPFVVHQCSDFEDKQKPDWKQMEKLAIQIEPVRISKKTSGFQIPIPGRPAKPEYEPAIVEDDEGLEDEDAAEEVAFAD